MPNNQIPVSTILKLVLDQSSAEDISQWLGQHERQWSNVERTVSRIGDHLEGLARMGLGLAGVAGVGGLLSSFVNTAQSGANVALAAGHATGNVGTWHPYQQAMLAAQSATGVQASEISAGLVQALQAAGGNPTAQQAAMIGGVLAGYGQVVGLTPAQVAQVMTPLLQAANRPLTAGGLLAFGAAMTGALTNFPGSQAAPVMQTIAGVALQQGLGSTGAGTVTTSDVNQIASLINIAAGSNSIFRNQQVTSGALQGIMGGMQGAYGNAPMEAFLQMAGIGYWEQRQGLSTKSPAGEIQKIMGEATRLYGTGVTRDMALRSMFGLAGAKLLEQFSPGTAAAKKLEYAAAHPSSDTAAQLDHIIHGALLSNTPAAGLGKLEGIVQHWAFQSIPHALATAGGITALGLGGRSALRAGVRAGGRLLSNTTANAAADALANAPSEIKVLLSRVQAGQAISSSEADVLDQWMSRAGLSATDVLSGGTSALGAVADAAGTALGFINPLAIAATGWSIASDISGQTTSSHKQYMAAAGGLLQSIARGAYHKFGSHWDSARGLAWMRGQIQHPGTWNVPGFPMLGGNDAFNTRTLQTMAMSGVQNLARELSQATSGTPINTHDSAVVSELRALRASQTAGTKSTAYSGGTVAQATAYTAGSGGGSGGASAQFVSFPSMGGGTLASTGGGVYSTGGAPAGAAPGSYSQAQLAMLWTQAGGDPRVAQTMAAIAMAESGGNPNARNKSSGAAGLWQILGLPFPGNPYDPLTNAKMAVAKYKSQGLGAWATYSSGAYKQFMSAGGGGVTSTGGGAAPAGSASAGGHAVLAAYHHGATAVHPAAHASHHGGVTHVHVYVDGRKINQARVHTGGGTLV